MSNWHYGIPRKENELIGSPPSPVITTQLSPEELEEIRRKYPATKIDKAFKKPIEIKPKPREKENTDMAKPALTREYIEEQFKLGLTARAIEEKLGMKQNTLAYHLKKWGISNPNPRKKNQQPTVLQEAKEQLRDVQPPDPVNNPQHYTFGGIETIDYIQAKLGPEGFQAFCLGNVLKYCSRHNHKGGMEDLRKARWYLDKIIQTEAVN